MKKLHNYINVAVLLLGVLAMTATTSCSKDDDEEDRTYNSLFSTTDYFVDMLDTVYERYDALGSKSRNTSDGQFKVTPMGRLIIVKINYSSPSVTYTGTLSALKNHYRNKSKVKDVFQNNGGTVTIDCRK